MRRRLNSRVLFRLLLGTIVLGAGVSVQYRMQVGRNTGALLTCANRAEQEGDLGQAAECLQLFLGYQPNHPAAFARFGMILASRARTPDDRIRAFRTLERALVLDPARPEIRRQLVDLAMGLEWYSAARAHLRVLVDSGRSISDHEGGREGAEGGELEYLLGICSEGLHDDTDAVGHYQKAISLAPQSPDIYVRLAGLLRNRLGDAQRADRVMDAREVKDGLIAANRQSFRAYLARGLYRKQYEIEGSDADVSHALRLAPREADVRLAAAALDVERGAFDSARQHLTSGLELHPRDSRILTALAWLEKKSGRLGEAAEVLRRGADASTDREERGRFLWLLADTLIDQGKWAEVKAVIGRLDHQPVRPELLKYLDARIGVGEARWSEARRQLEAIYPLLGRENDLAYQANLLIGLCCEQLGDLDQREVAFQRAVALDPERVEGRIGSAAAKEAMGQIDEAIDEYRKVIDRAPAAGMALARLLMQRNLAGRRRNATGRVWNRPSTARHGRCLVPPA